MPRYRLGRAPHEQAGGRLLADGARRAVQPHRELSRRGLRGLELDLRAGGEALVVEPVQEVAVVLGEADDRRARAGLELGERRQLRVLGLLDGGIDGPAVRAAL